MGTRNKGNLPSIVKFSDSNYASYEDDKKSTFGYIFMMIKRVVSWKSIKQTLTTSSIMETEYVVCYNATCHAIWLWNFISTLGVVYSISILLKLFSDIFAVITFSRNTRSISCSKHTDVKFYF